MARLCIPMIVPPATGPDPEYSRLSDISMSAADQLRVSGVLSSARTGLLGCDLLVCDRQIPAGCEAERIGTGRKSPATAWVVC